MAIDIDKAIATKLLNDSFVECSKNPVSSCIIKNTIDFVLNGKNCLTYRYIMVTAFLAKAVDPAVDILSLQAGDSSEGAYDARSLASKVVYKFQYSMLGNVLDGSNSDPLVNKPGRYLRLSVENAAAGGDPTKALQKLCNYLPKIETQGDARGCVDYVMSLLIEQKNNQAQKKSAFNQTASTINIYKAREFMSDLLDQGFGGASLVLVTAALYQLMFSGDEYSISVHPVNQSGASKRQFSDLDVFRDGNPYMGTELKDKPFSSSDVDHAAETAFKSGAKSLLFVAGRQSTFASQPPTYFSRARDKYANKGMYVGVTSIDALIDTVLASNMTMSTSHLLEIIRDYSEKIGALEAQMWIYEHLTNYDDQ